ncbi:hypothetical protein [Pedobacter sp.]|uniref:hypothetical protein n=1 Tax=Pedobacter sp. TaxID=1411316 RepID=UPI003BAA277F
MKAIKMTIVALVTVLSLAGCKKDVEKTTLEKIQGRWNYGSSNHKEVYPPSTNNTYAFTGKAGEYFDFRTDGKLYVKMEGDPEESETYTVDNDNQISISGEPFVIQQLTDNRLVIYSKQVDPTSSDAYTEHTYTLTR